jgi:PhnB protein
MFLPAAIMKLKEQCQMSTANTHIRHGIGTVRPYLYGYLDLLDFVKQVFGAEELERVEARKGFHIEVKIGDSVVVLEVGEPPATATRGSVYVYVPDVDAAYDRALRAGATSLAEPTDKPYQERGAGVLDTFGNTWWIATYTGTG